VSLSAPRGRFADVVEDWTSAPVVESSVPFSGLIFDVRRDRVDLGDGGVVVRDFIEHPGAVAVVALQPFDGIDHLLLIRQYRHAARGHVWELPAGLLDVPGEPHWKAAARELAEEVDLVAGQWDVLIDELVSAGAFPEPVRIFLARDLTDVPGEHLHERRAEELTIRPLWVPLDEAHEAALAARISNSAALIGVLAAHAARAAGWTTLRPRESPWPAWEAQRAADSPVTDES
jgi:ADP-ribose pyrophosphatase